MFSIHYIAEGVLFPFRVDGKTVEGVITPRALHEHDQPFVPFDDCAQFDALACFGRHRDVIERVAQEHYARQAFWGDGRIHIVNGELSGQ